MSLTCGFTGGSTESYNKLPGQTMIIRVRGGLEPLAHITADGADPWLSV
jgi:hypothetical protein